MPTNEQNHINYEKLCQRLDFQDTILNNIHDDVKELAKVVYKGSDDKHPPLTTRVALCEQQIESGKSSTRFLTATILSVVSVIGTLFGLFNHK